MADVFITGGARGIGLATAYNLSKRGHRVIIGSRSLQRGKRASHLLRKLGGDVSVVELDVADDASCQRATDSIIKAGYKIDVLINNAGIFADPGPALKSQRSAMRMLLDINAFGAVILSQAVAHHMKATGKGRIVNITSGMAGLNEAARGSLPYRMSKAALNIATVVLAEELRSSNIAVIAICPGWVRTRMTSGASTKSVDASSHIAYLACEAKEVKTGCLYRGSQMIPW